MRKPVRGKPSTAGYFFTLWFVDSAGWSVGGEPVTSNTSDFLVVMIEDDADGYH
jgi:hypothetical protein